MAFIGDRLYGLDRDQGINRLFSVCVFVNIFIDERSDAR